MQKLFDLDNITEYCAFDIETAGLAPNDSADSKSWAIGVTCAAGYSSLDAAYGNDPTLFWAGMLEPTMFGENFRPRMDKEEIRRMLFYLGEQMLAGQIPLTWNGSGFEFRVISAEFPEFAPACKFLAINHVDMFFQVYTQSANFVGLDKALRGMGFEGKKASGMTGAEAPEKWKTHPGDVLKYVQQDVIQPLELAHKVAHYGYLVWAAKGNYSVNHGAEYKARVRGWGSVILEKWLTVGQCFHTMSEPDTSWMRSQPPTRREMLGWMDNIRPISEEDFRYDVLPKELISYANDVGNRKKEPVHW